MTQVTTRFQGSVANFEIETYQVFLARSIVPGGTNARAASVIQCEGEDKQKLSIYFLDEGSDVPPNTYNGKTGEGTMYAKASRFPWYVDILRNESPVYAYVNQETPQLNRIHTGPEPVGEGEDETDD